MSTIFARSPYIITVDESGQTSAKIELFVWNGLGVGPSLPTYTLSKLIPSSAKPSCHFNISPYIREKINFNSIAINYNNTSLATPTNLWTNVKVKRYSNATLLDTTTYLAVDGYNFFAAGYNIDRGVYLLDQNTYENAYNYYYDADFDESTMQAGAITINFTSGQKARYTSYNTGVTTNVISFNGFRDLYRVHPSYWQHGNKLDILSAVDVVLATFHFRPIEECKYTVNRVDFVNKYGAWQREFFFKASSESFTMDNIEYNLMPTFLTSFNRYEGQRHTFNTNGRDSVKLNTGWVNESFSGTIKELLLSEKILVNSYPATISTKQVELSKSINTKNINYTLDFSYSFDTVMNVI